MRFEEFCKHFEIPLPKFQRIRDEFFLVDTHLETYLTKEPKPFSIGVPLGREKKDFEPTVAMLDLLKETKRYLVVNDKAEWLFLCDRDLIKGSITQFGTQECGLVLVLNERKEVLGLGNMNKDPQSARADNIIVKNMLNRGWFLGK